MVDSKQGFSIFSTQNLDFPLEMEGGGLHFDLEINDEIAGSHNLLLRSIFFHFLCRKVPTVRQP
jgi:hypothetical protein